MEWWSSGVREFKARALPPPYHYFITPTLDHSTARLLESDRMPCGFHLDGIENPVRVFRVAAEVIYDDATDVALDVDGGAGLQFLADLIVAAGIDNCIDVHMTCEMRRELAAIACEKIKNAGRKVTRRDDFGKGKRGERVRGRSERDDAVAAGDDWGNDRHQPEQGGCIRRQRNDHSSRFRDGKIEMRGRDRIYRSENLRKLVRPTGVINQAINRGRYFAARPRPRVVNAGKLVFQFEAEPFQHFGCVIQHLAPQIRAIFRPIRNCASCRPDRIAKIFSGGTRVISQHVSMPITRGNDASIFAAGEFSADEKLERFLHCQPASLSRHELRTACAAKKENAKHLFGDETER